MLVIANLLLFLTGGPALLMTWTAKRSGPEGPVGAHMITGPLALGQVIALGTAIGLGRLATLGIPAVVGWLALPCYFVAMVMLPIVALEQRWRTGARLAVTAGVVGIAALVNASEARGDELFLTFVGLAGAGTVAGIGAFVLGAWFVQSQRNAVARARAEVERQSEFERSQAAFQRGEWQKLPESPELWQLFQFTHSFDPDVRAQCRAKIAAMPGLPAATIELLGTGWAEHATGFLRDADPLPMAPLAPAFAAVLDAQCEKWQRSLAHDQNPGSWYANLAGFFDVAEKITADGGDVRASMARWAKMLRGKRGLEGLVARAERLAANP